MRSKIILTTIFTTAGRPLQCRMATRSLEWWRLKAPRPARRYGPNPQVKASGHQMVSSLEAEQCIADRDMIALIRCTLPVSWNRQFLRSSNDAANDEAVEAAERHNLSTLSLRSLRPLSLRSVRPLSLRSLTLLNSEYPSRSQFYAASYSWAALSWP